MIPAIPRCSVHKQYGISSGYASSHALLLNLTTIQTDKAANGQITTTLIRTLRLNREDRVGKLEWGANGSLGRAIIGKVCFLMLVR